MTKQELLLAATLLDLAADEFSNHGCNDFDLARFVPDADQRRALVKEYEDWNSRGLDFDPTADYAIYYDWALMNWLAHKLRTQAEAS